MCTRRSGRALEVAAVAVLAVRVPGKPITLAWCGDARAYLHEPDGEGPVLLTHDHNQRQRALDSGRYAPRQEGSVDFRPAVPLPSAC
ncbi:hypothetical protein [Streptomyces sp. NPDC054863]